MIILLVFSVLYIRYASSFRPLYIFILFYLAFTTRAGSPQQRGPITVGTYYLFHPVNFPCGRKTEYPEKTHDSAERRLYSFHMRTGFESTLLRIELGTLEVKGEWSDYYTTEARAIPGLG